MSEHRAIIRWQNSGAEMDYQRFPRQHSWEFEGGPTVPASAGADYKGEPGRVDPEEALVAAASSCHMLTFLAIAAKRKLAVAAYIDHAAGYLEDDGEGRLSVTRIELRPAVVFAAGTSVSAEELRKLHDSAHRNCFIANSIKATVTVIEN
jgi:organic hydroperoxide reductase OsmC/OhrA